MINKAKLKDYTDKLFYLTSRFGIKTAYKLKIQPLLTHYITNHGKGDRLDLEFQAIKDYLITIITPVIQKYSNIPESTIPIKENDIIWVCWWQGEQEMPLLVNKCYELLKRHANKHPIKLITKNNFKEYITLPPKILELFEAKSIPIQQFSDIMRMYLISHYGGIWIDATYWVTQNIEIPQDAPFLSAKTNNIFDSFVARGKWSINLLGGSKGSKLYGFIYDSLIEYWHKRKFFIDYFQTDYLVQIAYERFPDIKSNIDKYALTCPNLINIDLNQTNDMNLINKIIHDNAFIKLSWKRNYHKYDNNNNLTIYGYFLQL